MRCENSGARPPFRGDVPPPLPLDSRCVGQPALGYAGAGVVRRRHPHDCQRVRLRGSADPVVAGRADQARSAGVRHASQPAHGIGLRRVLFDSWPAHWTMGGPRTPSAHCRAWPWLCRRWLWPAWQVKQQRKPDHCMRTGVCVHVSSIALFCCPPKTEGGNKQQQTTTTSKAKRPLPTNEGDPLDQAGDQVRNRGRDGVLSLGLCSRAVGGLPACPLAPWQAEGGAYIPP